MSSRRRPPSLPPGRGLTEYCGTVAWFLSWIALVSCFCLAGLAILLRHGGAGAGAAGAFVLHLVLLSIAQIIGTLHRLEDRLERFPLPHEQPRDD